MNPRHRRPKETPAMRRKKVLSAVAKAEGLRTDLNLEEGEPGVGSHDAHELRAKAVTWTVERNVQLLRGIACDVVAQMDLKNLMKTILDQAIGLLGAERGILFLGRSNAAGLVPVLAVKLSGEELLEVEKVSRTILAEGKAGRLVIVPDALSDPGFKNVRSVQQNQMRSIVCAPLDSPSGPVGALYLDAPSPYAFPPDAGALLEAVGGIAAVALEKARIQGDFVRGKEQLREAVFSNEIWDRLVGSGARMQELRDRAAASSLLDQPIVIHGEPGSGCRLLAQAIHDAGDRSRERFIACSCAALREELLQGAILGRTGTASRAGYVEDRGLVRQADRGTLYLAGAEHLSDNVGTALVRIIQRGIFRPLGGRRDERVDLRLILSTSVGVASEGRRRRLPSAFRKVHPLQLVVPPLRERSEDIPELAAHFARAYVEGPKGRPAVTFTGEAFALLQEHPWPGNVQELRQVVERILIFEHKPVIDGPQVRAAFASVGYGDAQDLGPWSGRIRSLDEWEGEAIRQALLHTGGNKAEAARLLGIHRNTLALKVESIGIG